MKRTLAVAAFLMASALVAGACTVNQVAADDDDGGDETSAPACGFESVIPSMTCGSSHDGMVCPATVYCDACATDITVDCTCRDSGNAIGFQFTCDDCATFCSTSSGGGGGAGGGPMLTPDEQLCADFCTGSESVPMCESIYPDCNNDCLESLTSGTCETELRALYTCGGTSAWECVGERSFPSDCTDETNAFLNCTEQTP